MLARHIVVLSRRMAALVATTTLVACDRPTASEGLRVATQVTAALLPAESGAWAGWWRRDAYGRFGGRLPAGTPITVLVDGEPVAFRALVWERVVESGSSRALCARPMRTLLAWRGDSVEEGFLLYSEVLQGPISWPGPPRTCHSTGDGHPTAPRLIVYPRDTLEVPWFGASGRAWIDDPVLAPGCQLPPEHTEEHLARPGLVTCRDGVYRVEFSAAVAQQIGTSPWAPVSPRAGAAPTRRIHLPATAIGGVRFTVRCERRDSAPPPAPGCDP